MTPYAANDDDKTPARARLLIYSASSGALLLAVLLALLVAGCASTATTSDLDPSKEIVTTKSPNEAAHCALRNAEGMVRILPMDLPANISMRAGRRPGTIEVVYAGVTAPYSAVVVVYPDPKGARMTVHVAGMIVLAGRGSFSDQVLAGC